MRYLFILLMLIPQVANAAGARDPQNICTNNVEIPFGPYLVLQKLSKHKYEISQQYVGRHAILVTTSSVFKNTGLPLIKIKEIGFIDVELKNGFTSTYAVWKECDE